MFSAVGHEETIAKLPDHAFGRDDKVQGLAVAALSVSRGRSRQSSTAFPGSLVLRERASAGIHSARLAEAIIDAVVRGLSHVIFRFGRREKSAAGCHRVKPRAKIDLGFPAPRKCHTVPRDRAGKDLLPVRISNFVKTTFLVHSLIVPCSRGHRQPPFRKNSRFSDSTAILHSRSVVRV